MALVTALVVLLSLTLMAMMMVNTSTLDNKISGVTKEEKQAFFLAEAGIARVRSFFKEAIYRSRDSIADLPVVTAYYDGAAYNGLWGTEGSVGIIQYVDKYKTGITYNTLQWRFFRKRLTENDVPQYINKGSALSQFANPNDSALWSATEDSYNNMDAARPAGEQATSFNERYGRPAFYMRDNPANDNEFIDNLFRDFDQMGKVRFVGIYPPIGTEQSPGEAPRPFCTVRVEVETASGFRKMIEQEVMEPPVLPITASAQAAGTGSWDGAAKIRWGAIKTKENVAIGGSGNNVPYKCVLPGVQDCLARQGTSDKCYDKWLTASAGAGKSIRFDTNPVSDNTDLTTCASDCLGCDGKNAPGTRPYLNHGLYDNQAITLDYWNQGKVKDYASSINSVYTFNGTNFYQGDFSGSIPAGTPPISFGQLFNPAGEYMPKTELVYVQMLSDSVTTMNFDSNKIPGNYTAGTLYVDGSVNFNGGGGGKNIDVKNPDQFNGEAAGTSGLTGVNYKGVIYSTGDIGGTGTIKIFGGVLAEGSKRDSFGNLISEGKIDLSGSSEVWYDESLKEDGGPKQPSSNNSKWRLVN